MRVALAQMNPTVGDLRGNAGRIRSFVKRAQARHADIVVFPELALTGYPPEDLLLKPRFIADSVSELQRICSWIHGIAAVVGFVEQRRGELYNAAAVISGGRIADVYHKVLLPNYGVFDEHRYFRPGSRFPVYRMNGISFGINICEDIWHRNGPAAVQAAAGASLIININASPYEIGKLERREMILQERARENGVSIAYLNMVGGQDELVFDGGSMVCGEDGKLLARGRQFREELLVVDLSCPKKKPALQKRGAVSIDLPAVRHASSPLSAPKVCRPKVRAEEVYRALELGTADYVRKNGFRSVVIGLSGGVDSSLVAAIAADALGREGVRGVFMPSRYTSEESRQDALRLAANLGITVSEIPISEVLDGYLEALTGHFAGTKPDITEENLQARIRGNLLMALSNKFGWLVLTTGNKSEMSVGYATLYGDMAGGFAVIKDVPKTLVYELCRWRNACAGRPLIPERVLWKAPTAELRPGQKDTDSLPPYDELDPILRAYVEDEMSFADIAAGGYDPETVKRVVAMVDRSEYKRRQAPPGVKITSRAFGRDWRFPITNRYRSF
ncbi:MAG: NAD+ synthase [Thermodesulfovibrionales bacterium]